MTPFFLPRLSTRARRAALSGWLQRKFSRGLGRERGPHFSQQADHTNSRFVTTTELSPLQSELQHRRPKQLGFPGVPFRTNIGGLPSIGFSDGTAAIGSSGSCLNRKAAQLRDYRQSELDARPARLEVRAELRFEQFTYSSQPLSWRHELR